MDDSARKAVAIVSGRMDSVTLAYLLASEGFSLHLLSFNYGQRHLKELVYARLCVERLDAEFDIADISALGRLFKGSALTDDIPVPHGLYAAPNMAITVVPNRSASMLSIAYGVAVAVRPEDLPWERYLVGTPDELIEGLGRLHEEAPYDHLCFWGQLPGVAHEQALSNMRLFTSEVAPTVREAVGAA
jgi:hypothetical protein